MLVKIRRDHKNIYIIAYGDLDPTPLKSSGRVEVLSKNKYLTRIVYTGPNQASIEEMERVASRLKREGHEIQPKSLVNPK